MSILVTPDSCLPSKSPETEFREKVQYVAKILKAVTVNESESWVNALDPKTTQALKALQKEFVSEWGF